MLQSLLHEFAQIIRNLSLWDFWLAPPAFYFSHCLTILFHEFGHYGMARAVGIPVEKVIINNRGPVLAFTLNGARFEIRPFTDFKGRNFVKVPGETETTRWRVGAVLLAGGAVNIVLGAASLVLAASCASWYLLIFGYCSGFFGIFNLVPGVGRDGWELMMLIRTGNLSAPEEPVLASAQADGTSQ